jgi:hypothetical protein
MVGNEIAQKSGIITQIAHFASYEHAYACDVVGGLLSHDSMRTNCVDAISTDESC